MPQLFRDKRAGDEVRVWVAGCATGEEAYSIAMLLSEFEQTSADHPRIQIFATDLDERAIAVARDGFHKDVDVEEVSEARLQRFFHRDSSGYRIRRELRELVLFAPHNLIKDPPFSHIDLLTCRNVLIYLNRAIQRQLLDTFHFALRPGGFLFLGVSESADDASGLFPNLDKATHLYQSRRSPAVRCLPPGTRPCPWRCAPPDGRLWRRRASGCSRSSCIIVCWSNMRRRRSSSATII